MHVQDYCITRLAHEPVEHFLVLCLDNQNRSIGEETMSIGTINQTAVYPREVVNTALKHHARSAILVHNHPNGEAKPSRADIAVMHDIEKALTVMGMTLHNHLIIANTICVSFKSRGQLWHRERLTKNSLFFHIFRELTGHFTSPATCR